MKKYEEISEDVEKIFDEVRDNTMIPSWIEFKLLCNNKQKKEAVTIQKQNELVETLSDGINIVVVFNETIFNGLPPDMKRISIDEKLAGVAISDTDAISVEKADMCTYTGALAKHGDVKILGLHETVKSLYEKQKQNDEMEKAQRKEKRKQKTNSI
jgi:hypothetical protein